MAVLYRKYRPQKFGEVLGQKPIVNTLKNQVKRGEVSHAYLFTGTRGVGKTSIARIVAKAVNCPNVQEGEPCAACDICMQISQGRFLDLVEIDAASYTGVDNVRDIVEHVKFSPTLGKYKVIIIDEVHMLSKAAFNALLKTLEEPPKHAVFILATTEINKVLPTIISRTQRFDFKSLSASELERHLSGILEKESISFAEGVVQLVAQNADGSVRDSLSLLDKILTLGENASLDDARQLLGITDIKLCKELFALMLSGKAEEMPNFYDKLFEKGQDLTLFARDFLEFMRKILVEKLSPGQNANLPEAGEFASQSLLPSLIFFIRLFLKAHKELFESPNPAIPLLIASVEAAMRQKPQQGSNGGKTEVTAAPVGAETVLPQAKELQGIKPQSSVEYVPSGQNNLGVNDFDKISQKWMAVADLIRAINSPLGNLVKNVQLCGVESGFLVLGVKFLIHKQSLENPKNFGIVNSAIKQVSGVDAPFRVKVLKDEVLHVDAGQQAGLTDALKVFGGELVN